MSDHHDNVGSKQMETNHQNRQRNIMDCFHLHTPVSFRSRRAAQGRIFRFHVRLTGHQVDFLHHLDRIRFAKLFRSHDFPRALDSEIGAQSFLVQFRTRSFRTTLGGILLRAEPTGFFVRSFGNCVYDQIHAVIPFLKYVYIIHAYPFYVKFWAGYVSR